MKKDLFANWFFICLSNFVFSAIFESTINHFVHLLSFCLTIGRQVKNGCYSFLCATFASSLFLSSVVVILLLHFVCACVCPMDIHYIWVYKCVKRTKAKRKEMEGINTVKLNGTWYGWAFLLSSLFFSECAFICFVSPFLQLEDAINIDEMNTPQIARREELCDHNL